MGARKGNFYKRVYDLVKQIPPGQVASYGQIAGVIGTPRAARLVGWALRALPPQTKVPWHRVVNSSGRITIVNPHFSQKEQARRLRQEGILVEETGESYRVDLKKYLWY